MEECSIGPASLDDEDEIFALYRSMIGRPYVTWNDEYPARALVRHDLEAFDVFVMKDGDGCILSAIVNEDTDEFVDMAPWYPDVKRWAQFARLAVAADAQGQGIARRMLVYAMHKARLKGCEAVRFLVSADNIPAQRSYRKLEFEVCGEADAWGDHWLCYEKRL